MHLAVSIRWMVPVSITANLITRTVTTQSREEEGQENREDSLGLKDLPDCSSRKMCEKFPANINILLMVTQILSGELDLPKIWGLFSYSSWLTPFRNLLLSFLLMGGNGGIQYKCVLYFCFCLEMAKSWFEWENLGVCLEHYARNNSKESPDVENQYVDWRWESCLCGGHSHLEKAVCRGSGRTGQRSLVPHQEV